MFADVWTWAGLIRRRDTTIGVPWYEVRLGLTDLCADVLVQAVGQPIQLRTLDEVAVRVHHRLVLIHPFVNGHGRHARLVTNFLLRAFGRPSFAWV